jgi:hypothetical protein
MSDYTIWSNYNTSRYPICSPHPIGRSDLINENNEEIGWIEDILKEIEDEEKEKEVVESDIIENNSHSVSLKKPSVIKLSSSKSFQPISSIGYFSSEDERFFDPNHSEDINDIICEEINSDFEENSPDSDPSVNELEITECPTVSWIHLRVFV